MAVSACSSGSGPHRTSDAQVPRPAVAASQRALVRHLNAGIVPQCSDTVGLPTSIVVRGHNITTGASEVRCLTGAGDSDSTDVRRTRCSPEQSQSVTVYYWASADSKTVDQHVYAARADSTVRQVPAMTATALHDQDGAVAEIRRAAGC
jgi:mRNA-degrading endonuclease toxin of MazEF toxin-antitoxin module